MQDDGREGVSNCIMRQRLAQWFEAMRFHLGALTPHGDEVVIGVRATVIGDSYAGLLHPGPERIEARIGRGLHALHRGDGTGLDDDATGVALEHPFQLGHGVVEIRKRDVRNAEDALLVREAPVLMEPTVEGAERSLHRREIVDERLLHADTQRREEQCALDAEAVHGLEADLAVAVCGIAGKQIAEEILDAVALGIVAAEVLLEAARCRKHVEGRVRDEPIDLAAHQQHLLAVDISPLHAATLELGLDVAGERVLGLVVMVVGIEGQTNIGHVSPWYEPRQRGR